MKKKYNVKIEWSPSFSYIIGIIASDGNLSPDERHIVITSKDKILLENIRNFLCLTCTIGSKSNGTSKDKKYFVLQIGDKNFYDFLVTIGFTKNKSKTLGKITIPQEYFFHFFRGCVDGDGNIDVYLHRESSNKQLRLRLASASHDFLLWISDELKKHTDISGGWIYTQKNKTWHVLTYGKRDSIKILRMMYRNKTLFLNRKFEIAEEFI